MRRPNPRVPAGAYLQCDGQIIDATHCTCPPFYTTQYGNHSLDCPIDQHRIAWLQQHWEFDDDGTITIATGDGVPAQGTEKWPARLATPRPGCIALVDGE